MSEREKEEATRSRDAIEKKSKPKAPLVEDADDEHDPLDKYEDSSPDVVPNAEPLDEEAEEVERYAGARVGDSDTETEVEPAAPGVEVGFDGEDEGNAFHNHGHDIPEW